MRIGTGLTTLAVLGAMATTALAQPGGAGGRGRGGFGGFGGPQSVVTLAQNAAVQKELAVTEDQIAKLKTLGEEARAEMAPAGGGTDFAALRDLPEEERRAKLAELGAKRAEAARKVVEKFKPKLAEVLDAKQVERLNQIALQAQGTGAYSDPEVVAGLKISKEQQEKFAAVLKEYGEKQREMFTRGGGGAAAGGEDPRAKFRELTAARDKELAAVLTADQTTKFEKMKGKEFDVAALRGGFGGRGGEGRPGGGRPGGGRPNAEGRPKTAP